MAEPMLALFVILVAAFVFGEGFNYFHLPHILGYLVAGLILGLPVFQTYIAGSEPFIQFFTDIGIILLFFFVGLGIDLSHLRELDESLSIGFWTALLPFVLGFGSGWYLGLGSLASLVIGIALSVSAQAITIDLLEENGLLDSGFGRRVVGAGVITDILQLLAISLLFGLIPAVTRTPLHLFLAGWLAFFLLVFLLKGYILPFLLKFIEEEREEEASVTFFFGALILALFLGFLGDVLGVGSILGAIFAGALIRGIANTGGIRRLTKQFRVISFGFFIPVFFVWMGMQVGLGGVSGNIRLGLLFSFLAITGAIGGALVAYRLMDRDWREGILAGWSLQSKGDVELIIAAVALEIGAVSSGLFNSIVIMSTISMFLSPVAFQLTLRWLEAHGTDLS